MTEELIYTRSDIPTPVRTRRAGKSPRFLEPDAVSFSAEESVATIMALYSIQNTEREMGTLYGFKALNAADVSERSNVMEITIPQQAELLAPPASSSALFEDALEDLKECPTEAHEQSFLDPTPVALRNAEQLLTTMFKLLPRRFEVYPMPTGAIAIQASHAPEIAISVLCEPDGEVLCLVSAPARSRRAWYSTVDCLPDGFLREALLALKQFGE